MKKYTVIILIVFSILKTKAQDYLISFSGTGDTTAISSIKVDNLTSGATVTLNGGDILHLTTITGINDTDIANRGLQIYPNPITGQSTLTFFAPENGKAAISLVDLSGRTIYQISSALTSGMQSFSISGVSQGMYLVKVSGNNFNYSTKLVSIGNSHGKIQIEFVSSVKNTPANKLKNTSATIDMPYAEGDQLLYKGTSGEYSTIVTDKPTSSKTITFDFVACSDNDGNDYPVVQIGTQIWMAENLKTTKFTDGTDIPLVTDNTAWQNLTTPGYCFYNNDQPTYKNTYGALYNWYTVNTGNLCPIGWHVPSQDEWTKLTESLGGTTVAGGKLKEPGTTHWSSPNNGASNSSGFSALPGGYRYVNGPFNLIGNDGHWWSSTSSVYFANTFDLGNYLGDSHIGSNNKLAGYSVRCSKNIEEWAIMSNPTDPMLASVKTDNGMYEFYGDRDIDGIPDKLKLIVIKTNKDTITYSLDDLGRLRFIQNNNGFQLKYIWGSDSLANLIGISPNGEFVVDVPIPFTKTKKNTQYKSEKNILENNNITIDLIKCGNQVSSDVGVVKIEISNVQGNQEKTTIPVFWVNGHYVASLPDKNELTLNPSQFMCDKIANIFSNTICQVITTPTGDKFLDPTDVIKVSCSSAIPLIETIYGAAAGVALGGICLSYTLLSYTCKSASFYNSICNATYTNRIYDKGINLQPYTFYKGEKIYGTSISTIGGSQPIDLKLDMGCQLAIISTSSITSITKTTAASGGNIIDDGGSLISARGIVWSTTPGPTILNVVNNNITSDGVDIGSFTSNLTGLLSNTTYFVRAYATNSAGTAYGNEVILMTDINQSIYRGEYNTSSGGYLKFVYFDLDFQNGIGTISIPEGDYPTTISTNDTNVICTSSFDFISPYTKHRTYVFLGQINGDTYSGDVKLTIEYNIGGPPAVYLGKFNTHITH